MLHKFLWKDHKFTLETKEGRRGEAPSCIVLPTGKPAEDAAIKLELLSSKEALLARAGHKKERIAYLSTKQGIYIHYKGRSHFFAFLQAEGTSFQENEEYRSTMPGKILRLHVAEGDFVEQGESLLVLEAMKMENQICAKASGRIAQIFVKEADLVAADEALLRMDYSGK